ncbi:hypothetical protein EAH75_04505 [Rhodanobacter glycinis]|uniref:hypothetical protein n=1 Tax=Rhodanobacter glycinis TaxID=582702 RepID=UPI001127E0B3|nr:hypothetical protein [Rhodanobacter glycinis]TPG50705.1 hypothetical protein EAH75_04505 [Rhodanobacter glycinis]
MADDLHILQHALGVDKYGQGDQYRNHFVTGEGSIDHPVCMRLVDAGLMTRTCGHTLTGGDDLFRVTPAGIEYVALHSPAPQPEPKLTQSQKRYREWLRADPGYSFAEWIGVPREGRRYG